MVCVTAFSFVATRPLHPNQTPEWRFRVARTATSSPPARLLPSPDGTATRLEITTNRDNKRAPLPGNFATVIGAQLCIIGAGVNSTPSRPHSYDPTLRETSGSLKLLLFGFLRGLLDLQDLLQPGANIVR